MKPICVFFHCLTHLGTPPVLQENAVNIIHEQMCQLKASGLLEVCSEFIVGLNGADESLEIANILIPAKAKIVLHGLQCRSECRTIVEMEQWVKGNPGWNVLYFHTKGAVTECDLNNRWRRCMMRGCVDRWEECVQALDQGYEAVGVHWWPNKGVHGDQHYYAGNFFWATSSFLRTLPSIYNRARIKESGIDSVASRYESEVWLGNGPRLPRVKDMDKSHALMRCP